jgi:hypothetical protein
MKKFVKKGKRKAELLVSRMRKAALRKGLSSFNEKEIESEINAVRITRQK